MYPLCSVVIRTSSKGSTPSCLPDIASSAPMTLWILIQLKSRLLWVQPQRLRANQYLLEYHLNKNVRLRSIATILGQIDQLTPSPLLFSTVSVNPVSTEEVPMVRSHNSKQRQQADGATPKGRLSLIMPSTTSIKLRFIPNVICSHSDSVRRQARYL